MMAFLSKFSYDFIASRSKNGYGGSGAVPSSSRYLHFGKAQDRTNITLSPGIHTLQLLLGDGNHFPHNQPLISKKITIEVKP